MLAKTKENKLAGDGKKKIRRTKECQRRDPLRQDFLTVGSGEYLQPVHSLHRHSGVVATAGGRFKQGASTSSGRPRPSGQRHLLERGACGAALDRVATLPVATPFLELAS